MSRFARLFGSCLVAVFAGLIAVGQPPAAPPAKLTPEQQEKIKALNNLIADANKLERQGKLVETRAALEKSLAIMREVLRDEHSIMAALLERLTRLCARLEDFPAAQGYAKEALAVRKKLHGEDHWKTINARVTLADVELLAGLSKEKRVKLNEVDRLMVEVARFYGRGEYQKAVEAAEKVLAIRKEVFGEKHHSYATSLNNLALMYNDQGLHAKAEPLYKEALAIQKAVLGEKHPAYATSLDNLANLYRDQGIHAKAEPLFKEAITIRKAALGEKHPDYARSLSNLGVLYYAQRLFAKAEPRYQEALAITKAALGEKHPDYATCLNNLAMLYNDQGLYAKAEPLYKESLAVTKEVLGEKHPSYATSLNSLACLYYAQRLFPKAEPLFKEALAIRKAALGEKHPAYATSVNNLALMYNDQGLYAKAEPLYQEAMAIRKAVLGEKHPDYAHSLNNLAGLYYAQRLFAKAEPLFKETLEIDKAVLGKKHPDYARSLNNLAVLYNAQGLAAKAEPLYKDAIGIIEEHLEQTAAIQSEASQLDSVAENRLFLNNYLLLQRTKPAAVYESAFRWRGAVTARQAFARAARDSNPEVQRTLADLRVVANQLSNLVNNPPKPGVDVHTRQTELNAEREKFEKRLAGQSQSFAKYQESRALTVADIQKLLPPDAVLVDFLAYEDKIAAFIFSSKAVARVDLQGGKELAKLVKDFRQPLSLKRTRPVQGEEDDSPLYTAVWEPLVPYLTYAKLILICPDGPLCEVPFAALRGTDPKKYLIEEVALAVIPVPRLLPELLAHKPAKPTAASLLAVGDVAFDADPAAGKKPEDATALSPTRGGGVLGWDPLPGSKVEVEAIQKLFRKAVPKGEFKALTKGDATEAVIRREAGRYKYLHFATHGFFAAPTGLAPTDRDGGIWLGDRVRANRLSPGLLCGLVCAGANKPTPDDDGVLTALEVADLDLGGVEIAVLSACQTGLGDVAGGDGVLGLQRAFQLAGTRTTVTSLWKVPDDATSALMIRFYENRFNKGLPALEALREAQLWLLNGKKVVKDPTNDHRTPPLNWAAFVLAGDWR